MIQGENDEVPREMTRARHIVLGLGLHRVFPECWPAGTNGEIGLLKVTRKVYSITFV